jgi:hypothetical protein
MDVTVFCGIDWAEDHHDVALVDEAGTLLAKRRIGDDARRIRSLDFGIMKTSGRACRGDWGCSGHY